MRTKNSSTSRSQHSQTQARDAQGRFTSNHSNNHSSSRSNSSSHSTSSRTSNKESHTGMKHSAGRPKGSTNKK